MKQIRFLMTEVACWPYRAFGQPRMARIIDKYNIWLLMLGFTLPFVSVAHLLTHREMSFGDMGNSILIIFLDFMYLQQLLLSRQDKFSEMMKHFLNEFHLFYHLHRSDYAKKISRRIHLISGAFSLYVIVLLHGGISIYNAVPVLGNYKIGMYSANRPENTTFLHPAYYYSPKDFFLKTLSGYFVLFFINIFMSLVIAGILTNFDLTVYIIVFQIWGHLKVLKHGLYNIPPPQRREGDADNGMYSPEENKHIQRLLKEQIEHHQLIIAFVDKCTDVLGDYLFMFYANIQVISCILLLEMQAMSLEVVIKFISLFIAVFVSLIQCSFLFELLNTKSTQLIDAVYELPWDSMDTNNRKTVMFFLKRSQRPLNLKAGKVIPVGVQTMFTVLKTSCSYFMMLQTMAKDK